MTQCCFNHSFFCLFSSMIHRRPPGQNEGASVGVFCYQSFLPCFGPSLLSLCLPLSIYPSIMQSSPSDLPPPSPGWQIEEQSLSIPQQSHLHIKALRTLPHVQNETHANTLQLASRCIWVHNYFSSLDSCRLQERFLPYSFSKLNYCV